MSRRARLVAAASLAAALVQSAAGTAAAYSSLGVLWPSNTIGNVPYVLDTSGAPIFIATNRDNNDGPTVLQDALTSAISTWSYTGCQFGGTVTATTGSLGIDGQNGVFYVSGDGNWPPSSSWPSNAGPPLPTSHAYVAWTYVNGDRGSGTLREADVVINGVDFQWHHFYHSDLDLFDTLTGRELEATMLHELGHTIGLAHTDQNPDGSYTGRPNAVMDTLVQDWRVFLLYDDWSAICAYYPSASSNAGSASGATPCTSQGDCQAGVCASTASDGSNRTCATPCMDDCDCAGGTACVASTAPMGGPHVCAPGTNQCPAGSPRAGAVDGGTAPGGGMSHSGCEVERAAGGRGGTTTLAATALAAAAAWAGRRRRRAAEGGAR